MVLILQSSGQGAICPEPSTAKGCVRDSRQGIPTSGTRARQRMQPGHASNALPGQISPGREGGGLLLPVPARLGACRVGGESLWTL